MFSRIGPSKLLLHRRITAAVKRRPFHRSPAPAANLLDGPMMEQWLESDTTAEMFQTLMQHRRKHPPRRSELGGSEDATAANDLEALYRKHLGQSSRYQLCRLDTATISTAVLFDWLSRPSVVHPVKHMDDVELRKGPPNQRLYGLFHDTMLLDDHSSPPLVLLQVSFQPSVPSTLQQVLTPVPPSSADDLRVATFYSIALLEPGAGGLGLGALTLKRAMDDLTQTAKDETTTSTHNDSLFFVTLSPMHHAVACPQAAAQALVDHPDAVATFHLGNGAQLFRVNHPDPAFFGGRCNVNYRYDPQHMVERRRAFREHGTVSTSEHVTFPSSSRL